MVSSFFENIISTHKIITGLDFTNYYLYYLLTRENNAQFSKNWMSLYNELDLLPVATECL